MSTLGDLSLWRDALDALDSDKPEIAASLLSQITEQSSRIRLNTGLAYERAGQDQLAVMVYTDCMSKDAHFVLSNYQRGCIHYRRGNFTEAVKDFEDAHKKLRGNKYIDFSRLNMKYKLYECDVLHNQGVSVLRGGGDFTRGMDLLIRSQNGKAETRHQHIDDTLSTLNNSTSRDYSRLSLIVLPKQAVFRPPAEKIRNMKQIDFLGKSKLVAAKDNDDHTGFSGSKLLEIAKQRAPARSAPSSPVPERRTPAGNSNNSNNSNSAAGPEAQLVRQLHRALSPDTPSTSSKAIGESRTPPARWSPTSTNQRPIPPPPTREVPVLPRQQKKAGPVPVIMVDGAETGADAVPGLPARGSLSSSTPSPTTASPASHSPASHSPASRSPASRSPASRSPASHSPSSRSPKTNKRGLNSRTNGKTSEIVPPPPSRAPITPPSADLVPVTLICTGTREILVPEKSTLVSVAALAAQAFQLDQGDFNLWRKNSKGDFQIIKSNPELQRSWDRHRLNNERLTLWMFGKE